MYKIFILLKVSSIGYVTNENIKHAWKTHAKLHFQIDGAFSCVWKVEPTRESIREAGDFVASSMETRRKCVLSITPKAHIFKTMQYISCRILIVWVIRPNILFGYSINMVNARTVSSQVFRYYKQNYESQYKTGHQASHPKAYKVN